MCKTTLIGRCRYNGLFLIVSLTLALSRRERGAFYDHQSLAHMGRTAPLGNDLHPRGALGYT